MLKFSIREMKDWNRNPILPGAIVDNLYVRQEGKEAEIRILEFVLFQTK